MSSRYETSDILRTPIRNVQSSEEANGFFVVEQIIYPRMSYEEIRMVVRDKTGGLHLASPASIQGAISYRSIKERRNGPCVEEILKTTPS